MFESSSSRPKPSRPQKRSGYVFSFPKSGRTWLAYQYAFYCAYRLLGDAADDFIDTHFAGEHFDYEPWRNAALLTMIKKPQNCDVVPILRFTHRLPRGVSADQVEIRFDLLKPKPTLFLFRNPRDVTVSYFHHLVSTRRRAPDTSLSAFVRDDTCGIRFIVACMNQIATHGPQAFPRSYSLFYEDMVRCPASSLKEVLLFFEVSAVDDSAIERAVTKTGFSTLQAMDRARRIQTNESTATNALRFRRGPQGAHSSELASSDLSFVNDVVRRELAPALARYVTCADPA